METQFGAALDSCDHLFLREVSHPDSNSVRIVVREAAAAAEKFLRIDREQSGGLAEVLEGAHEISSMPQHRTFEILWCSYVAYSVTNESYSAVDANDEQRISGRLFRQYSKSHFLEHISRSTVATNAYPGPLQHFSVVCLDHIFDIVSCETPQMRVLSGSLQGIM
jgi:hypothetical protein